MSGNEHEMDKLKKQIGELQDSIVEYRNDLDKYEDALNEFYEEHNFDAAENLIKLTVHDIDIKTRNIFTKLITKYNHAYTDYFIESEASDTLLEELSLMYKDVVTLFLSNIPRLYDCRFSKKSANNSDGIGDTIGGVENLQTGTFIQLIESTIRIVFKNIIMTLYQILSEEDKDYVKQDKVRNDTVNFFNKLKGKLLIVNLDTLINDQIVCLYLENNKRRIKTMNQLSRNDTLFIHDNRDYQSFFITSINNLLKECLFCDSLKEDFHKILIKYFNPDSNSYTDIISRKLPIMNYQNFLDSYIKNSSSNTQYTDYFLNYTQLPVASIIIDFINIKNSTDIDEYCNNDIDIFSYTCNYFSDDDEQKQFNNALKDYKIYECSFLVSYEDYHIKNVELQNLASRMLKEKVFNRDYTIRDYRQTPVRDRENFDNLFYEVKKYQYSIDPFVLKLFYENLYNSLIKFFHFISYCYKSYDILHNNLSHMGTKYVTVDLLQEVLECLKTIRENLHHCDFSFKEDSESMLLFASDVNFELFKDKTLDKIVYSDIHRNVSSFLNSKFSSVKWNLEEEQDRDHDSEVRLKDNYLKRNIEIIDYFLKVSDSVLQEFKNYDPENMKHLSKVVNKLKLYY